MTMTHAAVRVGSLGVTKLGGAARIAAAVVAYGAALYVVLPPSPIVINDDFGYLRSIVETVAHGRPWTNDWLAPWSASLSVLAVVLFRITGSFHIATAGAQALFGAAAVAGAAMLLRARGLTAGRSAALAIVAVSFPTLEWKSLEFTGVALYLPCLIWAIWAAEQRRWGLFFLVWVVAIASRQSAIIWLALPAWALWSTLRATTTEPRAWARPACVLAVGALVFLALSGLMNHTHSQSLITDHVWERLSLLTAARGVGVGAAAILTFLGLGALAIGMQAPLGRPAGRSRLWAGAVLSIAVVFLVALRIRGAVSVEHTSYSGLSGQAYSALLIMLAVWGWIRFRFAVRREMILAAAGGLALLALPTQVWDYYVLDAALFAFFSPVIVVASDGGSAAPRPSATAWWGICLLVAAFHARAMIQIKGTLDDQYAVTVLAEGALSQREIEPADLSFAPFGLAGWHLHPYFVGHEGRTDPRIEGFTQYLRPGVRVRYGPRFTGDEPLQSLALFPSDDPLVIRSDVFPVHWFWRQRVGLERFSNSAAIRVPLTIDAASYQFEPFPLTDQQWRALLNRAARR